jgi:hypothetical protein
MGDKVQKPSDSEQFIEKKYILYEEYFQKFDFQKLH